MQQFSEDRLDEGKNKTKRMMELAGVVLLILGVSLYGLVWQFFLREHPPTVQIGHEEISVGLSVQKVTERGFLLYNSENQLIDSEDWELPGNTAAKEQFHLCLTSGAMETSVFVRLYNAAEKKEKIAKCIIYEIDCLYDQASVNADQPVVEMKLDGTDYRGMSAEEAIIAMSGNEALHMDEKAYRARPSSCIFTRGGYQYVLQFDQHGVKLKGIQVRKQMDFIDEGGK